MTATPETLNAELLRAASQLARRRHVARLLYVCDLDFPEALLKAGLKKKLVSAVSSVAHKEALDEAKQPCVLLPEYELGWQEKFRLALFAAVGRGYLELGDQVVGLVARRPRVFPDTLLVARVEEDVAGAAALAQSPETGIPPSVLQPILELALELGFEGWEGHAVGTIFVVGDSPQVMESSRQIALNPFQGYSESERNLADPAVREALRNFATLEGAFVVREDGVVLAAGRYLEVESHEDVEVPLGLGARHMAGALVTRATNALAVVVSQTSGKVRVFKHGQVVLELTPSHRRT
jgi:diadenylate cyclase